MKIAKKLLCAASAMLVLAGAGLAAKPAPTAPRIAWIDPASPFASYLEAAVQKKHVPVEFTIKKKVAALLVTIDGQKVRNLKEGGSSSLSMSVANRQSGIVTFSYTCQKGGRAFGQGFQSAAECLAKHWGDHLKKQDR